MARITTQEKDRRLTARYWGLAGVALTVVMVLLLSGTTPDRVGPIGITGFFFTLMLALFCWGMWLRALVLRSPKSTSLLAVILISTLSTGALALNTIDLQLGEIFLLLIFAVTLVIYWTKLR